MSIETDLAESEIKRAKVKNKLEMNRRHPRLVKHDFKTSVTFDGAMKPRIDGMIL